MGTCCSCGEAQGSIGDLRARAVSRNENCVESCQIIILNYYALDPRRLATEWVRARACRLKHRSTLLHTCPAHHTVCCRPAVVEHDVTCALTKVFHGREVD